MFVFVISGNILMKSVLFYLERLQQYDQPKLCHFFGPPCICIVCFFDISEFVLVSVCMYLSYTVYIGILPIPDMTCNVFDGTLNLVQLNSQLTLAYWIRLLEYWYNMV